MRKKSSKQDREYPSRPTRFIASYPVLRKKIYSEAVDCSFIACVTVQTVPLGKDTGLAETCKSRAWLKGVSSS